jgi:uncharacterized protein
MKQNPFCRAAGFLRDEFDQLYAALFTHHDQHVKVIRELARKRSGLTRQQLRDQPTLETTSRRPSAVGNQMSPSSLTSYTPTPYLAARRDTR